MKKTKGNPISIEGIVAISLLCVIILSNVFAPWIAPYPPNETNMQVRLQPPSSNHLLGTDTLGRDMLSRVLYGGRTSMVLALFATLFSMLLGIIVGAVAGYFGGIIDWTITWITNIFQGLPGTSFMIAIAGIMGPSIYSLLLALVITSWAGFSRIVRTEVLQLRDENYIEGMRCLGASSLYIIIKHILPNMMGNTIILFTTRIGRSLLSIAALSFLGLGLQPPTPDWSVMISEARMNFRSSPHLIIAPGFCIFLLLLSINLLGDALRDHFDIKNQEVRQW